MLNPGGCTPETFIVYFVIRLLKISVLNLSTQIKIKS